MTQAEWIVVWLCAIAAFLHGISGFGFPMLSTAALSSEYSLSMAVTLVIVPCLLLNLWMLNSHPKHSLLQSIRHYTVYYWPLILSSLAGSVLGVKLLVWINEAYLKLLLGLVIIFYVLDQLRASPFRVSNSLLSMLSFGLLAGVIGGATNAMAPFLMMYLLSCQLTKTDIVIISNLNFMVSKLVQLALLFPVLVTLHSHQRQLLVGITLCALVGIWLGGKIRHRLSQQHFKYLVLVFLFGLGSYALWQSIGLLQQSTILFN